MTDPPYGLGKKLNGRSWGSTKNNEMAWDKETLPDVIKELLNLAPKVCIWGGNYYALPPSRGWLSWYKPDAPPTMAQIELAWTNQDQNAKQISYSIAATNPERLGHPTQKPLAVIQWAIKEMKMSFGTVCDPFFGSGTTILAAVSLGLSAVGIEIDERFCEMAVKRYEKFTKQANLFAPAQTKAVEQVSLF